tara:strand:- start:13 stop:492 length:480 start_codon:yes stop_codon:yes gene_type:complete
MAKVETKINSTEAWDIARQLINEVKYHVHTLQVAGSIRREAEEIGDIDIVVIPKIGFRERVEKLIEVTSSGKRKIYGNYKGRPINFFITDPKSWGACLMTATGPARYNIRKRYLVKRKGFLLNEYGLFDRESGEFLAGKTEGDIYKYLGWTHRSPCERE